MPHKDLETRLEYNRRRNRAYTQGRKKIVFDGKKCFDCGTEGVLRLFSMDRSARTEGMWFWPQARLDAFVAQALILCVACRDKRAGMERSLPKCGSQLMYVKFRCRCELCRAWKRQARKGL